MMKVSSFSAKKSFIERGFPSVKGTGHACLLDYYHMLIRFASSSASFIDAIRKYHPMSWHHAGPAPQHEFIFLDYKEFFDEDFFEEEDPEFHVFNHNDARVCIQRDFIGWTFDDKKFYFITRLEMDDGYFNCLRWVVPGLLLKCRSMVLHSSSFVTKGGEAYLFLGASGAGKTTTIKRFMEDVVLGDDMNIITVAEGKAFVQSGAIGGQIVYPRFDQAFHLKKIFWLKKNSPLKVERVALEEARLLLLGSVANIFFGSVFPSFLEDVLGQIENLIQTVPIYQLSLMKEDTIWPLIQDV